ncbi:outer membrane beta-barrel family protein [Mucilaginibacter sp.]|uniref:outer membrane beta-barrel family protein n=1 Tax=Mucilaginibacter sp. TaxID=1882438 RepID=UPI002611FC8C|nr:outer membrane beta-barrel family protein [Mucilaginibacter sp.]MDB4926578.1 TonB-denpendent receptor [Mucilaginibacter sp.]
MAKQLIYTVLFLLLGSNLAWGQNINIIVKDSVSNQPLSYVTVSVKSIKDSTKTVVLLTDKIGTVAAPFYELGDLLKISFVGYKTKFYRIINSNPILIRMQESSTVLNGVTITEKPASVVQIPEGYVYNIDKSTADINVNTSQLLKKLPGMTPEQNGELRLLGRPVIFYIDGRPSLLSGNELKTYLQSLNLNDVKNIKVLSNPGSNYDASGGSIIDISTNKNLLKGMSYRIDGNGATHDKYGGAAAINYKSNAYTGKYNFNFDHSNYYNNSGYTQHNKNSPDSISNYQFRSETNDNPTRNIGINLSNDFAINKNNTVGFILKYNQFEQLPSLTSSVLNTLQSNGDLSSVQKLDRLDQADSKIYYIDFNYRSILSSKGNSLILDAYYWKRHINNNFSINQEDSFLLSNSNSSYLTSNISNQDLAIKSVVINYNQSINKYVKMIAGGKLTDFSIDGNFNNNIYDATLPGYVADPNQTYDLTYKENVYALFLNLNGNYKKLQYSAGLRGEGTSLDLKTTRGYNTENQNNYFNLFPSAALTYTLSKISTLSLSYSKRIYRVSYSQLNPINFRIDPSTSQEGNPALTPSRTDNVSFTYSLQPSSKHSYTFTGSFSNETNPYTWILLPDAAQGTYINQPQNYKTFKYLSVNFYTQQVLNKVISLNLNLFASRQIYDLSNLNLPDPNSVNSYRGSLSTDFRFWKNAVFEIFGNFKSKTTLPFGTGGTYQYIDFTCSKRFLNDALSVTLTLNDAFNLNKNNYQNDSPYYTNSGYLKNESRIGQIALSYRFGKTKKNNINDFNTQEDSRFKN